MRNSKKIRIAPHGWPYDELPKTWIIAFSLSVKYGGEEDPTIYLSFPKLHVSMRSFYGF